MKLKRFLFAGCFDKRGRILLVIKKKEEISGIYLPGGKVSKGDLSPGNETWRRSFLAKRIKNQTGYVGVLKNGKPIPIIENVQPIPATYNVNICNQEYSAIIVGIVNGKTKEGLPASAAIFYGFKDFMHCVKAGFISPMQELLILRIFVSRDNPNKNNRKLAAVELMKKHK
ncbi:MAG: hypothetical protein WCX30_01570 [Candidatus Paceibacterota bacterium]|jgi:hypothetical protein|nr:hypothetical protein [bacterium]